MNDKYPRTYHLPWSDGCTSDDKKLVSADQFLSSSKESLELIITEKLDGSNACLTSEGVFARSHAKVASHASFNLLKAKYATIKHLIKEGEQIFGENCYAVHSIIYNQLPDVFFVFGIKQNNSWLSFEESTKRACELGLTMVPVLFKGTISREKELKWLSETFMNGSSVYGGEREGFVVRIAKSFSESEFTSSVAKFVRSNHVQTDDHWMHQVIRPQNIIKNK